MFLRRWIVRFYRWVRWTRHDVYIDRQKWFTRQRFMRGEAEVK